MTTKEYQSNILPKIQNLLPKLDVKSEESF